jgi:hypothetical protein
MSTIRVSLFPAHLDFKASDQAERTDASADVDDGEEYEEGGEVVEGETYQEE